jgi:hypothetical protein
MSRLYLTPTPNATADSARDNIASAIEQIGLIDVGGAATENIATESVDLQLRGRVQFGPRLNNKVATELESLAESQYTAVPFVDDSTTGSLERKRGYYELERADVTPAHPVSESLYEYDLRLTFRGTAEDSLRQVRTTIESVTSPLATGSPGTIAIPSAAIRPRWYTQADGPETATPIATESAEFGDVDIFEPSTAPYADPSLIYRLPFDADGPTDARVLDTFNRDKFATESTGGQINQWVHVYHTGYQFTGDPVIDTGRIRVFLDVTNGRLQAEEYNPSADVWDPLNVTMGDYALRDFSFQRIGPAGTTVRLTFENTTDGTETALNMNAYRGDDRVLIRPLIGETIPQAVADIFSTIGSTDTTDPNPVQTLLAREDV